MTTLESLKWYGLQIFWKAVFHKLYLVHSWIPWPKEITSYLKLNLFLQGNKIRDGEKPSGLWRFNHYNKKSYCLYKLSRGNVKGTLIQIWKSAYMIAFMWKQYPENFEFLILRILGLFTRKVCIFLRCRLLLNVLYCFCIFVNKHFTSFIGK